MSSVVKGKDELEVIKYFLKNVKYFQKMTILYTPPFEFVVTGEIRAHEKASADVIVTYRPI